jgi:hypothetical protein
MTPEPKPRKSEWMQIAESDNASSNVRKVDKRLTLGTLVSVGAIVIAGSLFANASDEPNAVADITPVASTSASTASSTASASAAVTAPSKASSTISAATPSASKIKAPAIAQMPKGGGDDDDDNEHEGREGRDRGGDHEDGDEGDEEDD